MRSKSEAIQNLERIKQLLHFQIYDVLSQIPLQKINLMIKFCTRRK